MAYSPPSVGPAGLTIPTYSDILSDILAGYLSVVGSATYVGPETDAYQIFAILALKINDTVQLGQFIFNNLAPGTAIGAALDSLVKFSGIARLVPTNSTCLVTLSGTIGAIITNGVVQDVNGNLWDLPSPVTIGGGGTVQVQATAQVSGNITATAGQLNIPYNPQAGWSSVTNAATAVPGNPVEADSQLRARFFLSVALPSNTRLAGTIAAIAATSGVTRYNVLENYFAYTASYGVCNTSGSALTLVAGYPLDASDVGQGITINGTAYTISAVGSGGTTATLSSSAGALTAASFYVGDNIALGPQHSVTAVVEGGSNAAVAQAIYNNRGIGPPTNGTTQVVVTDPTNGGVQMTIGFYRPTYLPIYVALNIHPLNGYTSATAAAIQAAIAAYFANLQIGQSVIFWELYAAQSGISNPTAPLFSIRGLFIGTSGGLGAVTTANGGTGFSTGNTLTVGGGTGGTVTVTSVGSGGLITGLSTPAAVGTGYTLASGETVTGGAGSGATVNITQIIPTGTSDLAVAFNGAASLGQTPAITQV